jgi:hypothetical protein
MMTFLSLSLLTVFLATILAQDYSFCTDGELPLNGDLVIFEDFGDTLTCNHAFDLVKSNSVRDCKFIFDTGYAFLCRCPGVKAGLCPGLYPDGSNVTSPELVIDSFGSTCAVLDQIIKGICIESIYEIDADSYADARIMCGCKSVYCQPCLEGFVPFDFLQVPLSLPNGTDTTCSDFDTSVVDLNSAQCSMLQDAISTKCGCPTKQCTICPGGEQISVATGSFLNFTELDFRCYFASLFTEGYQPNCTDQTETGLPYLCGCPNAELPSDAVGCTLCADGTLSYPNLIPFNNAYTCEGINFLLSVANQSICDEAQASENAYLCGCSGVEAPVGTGSPSVVTKSPSIMGEIQSVSGGEMGDMGGGSPHGMGMMSMFASRLLRSGNLGNIFPPHTARGLAM